MTAPAGNTKRYVIAVYVDDVLGDFDTTSAIVPDSLEYLENATRTHYRGSIREPGDADATYVRLVSDTMYRFLMKGSYGSTDRTLFAPDIVRLYAPDTGQAIPGTSALMNTTTDRGTGNSVVHYHTSGGTAGDYLLVVGGYESTGTYDLVISEIADDTEPDNISTSGTISAGGSVDAGLNYRGDADWFRVSGLKPGEEYYAEARTLRNGRPVYQQVAFKKANGSSTGYGWKNYGVTFKPYSSGTYYAVVYGVVHRMTGPYTLYLHEPFPLGNGDDPLVGQKLTVDLDEIDDPDGVDNAYDWKFEWYRIDRKGKETRISDARSRRNYTPTRADLDHRIRVKVTYRNKHRKLMHRTSLRSQRVEAPDGVQWQSSRYSLIEQVSGVPVTVLLHADVTGDKTIPIMVTPNGDTQAADLAGVPASVTFDGDSETDTDGNRVETFTVTAPADQDVNDESITLSFGTLPEGVLLSDNAETEITINDLVELVPYDWKLAPADIEAGEDFRVLFASSELSKATSGDIDTYNSFIRRAVQYGLTAFRDYADHTAALGSTDDVDARDNTATTHTSSEPGVPVYWLRGPRVADSYADFYDGTWENGDPARVVTGETISHANLYISTGSESDGTKAVTTSDSYALGSDEVNVGHPPSEFRHHNLAHSQRSGSTSRRLYGLSYVLRVAEPDAPYMLRVGGLAVTSTPRNETTGAYGRGEEITFTVTFNEAVDVVGDPDIRFRMGHATKRATYRSGSGTTKLVFSYTVRKATGEYDTDGIFVAGTDHEDYPPFRLTSTERITRAGDSSVKARLYAPELGTLSDHKVDGNAFTPLARISWESSEHSIVEGAHGATVKLQLTDDLGAELVVPIVVTLEGDTVAADYSGVPQTVTFDDNSPQDADDNRYETFTVRGAKDDDIEDESFTLSFGTLLEGLVAHDNTETEIAIRDLTELVPFDWSLAPQDIEAGEDFRVIFATSNERDATSSEIGTYEQFVRDRVASHGHSDLRTYRDHITVLGSTDAVAARDLTATSHTTSDPGVPIYWLDGLRVADHYKDFYDGSWSNGPSVTDETGGSHSGALNDVFTGTNTDGAKGTSFGDVTTLGSAEVTVGTPNARGSEIFSGTVAQTDEEYFYGLSYVLRITEPDAPYMLRVNGLQVTSAPAGTTSDTYGEGEDIEFTLTFNEAVDVVGDPRIRFFMLSTAEYASYSSGSGSAELVFTYTVQSGDNAALGILVRGSDDATSPPFDLDTDDRITRAGDATVDAVLYARELGLLSDHKVDGSTSSSQEVVNNPPTGAPTIGGNTRVGETLTASTIGIADEDGLTGVSYGYQWIRNDGTDDTDISGATSSAYTLVDADQGKTIKVRVTFTDDGGTEESLTSAATSVVAAAGLRPDSATVNGTSLTLTYGETLDEGVSIPTSAFAVSVEGSSRSVSGVSVSGSTVVLTLTSAVQAGEAATVGYTKPDGPNFIRSTGGATGASFTGMAVTNTLTPSDDQQRNADNNPATGVPTITGTAQVSETLTASTTGIADDDGLTKASFSYQWLRNDGATDTEIGGATSSTYTLTDDDQGKAIKVQVSFTDDAGHDESLTSAATAAVKAAPVADTLTGFTLVDTTDQSWLAMLTDGSRTTLDNPANGNYGIRVEVAENATIGSVRLELTGAKTASQTENIAPYSLYGDDDGDLHGESLPAGSYTLTATAYSERNLGGEKLQELEVSFTVVARPNRPATGAPAITGTAQVGETLTAGTSGIADEDGLTNVSYSYQWLADDADIAGATASTYTLTDSEEGKAVKVRVSFTDDADHDESLASQATGAVAAAESTSPPPAPTNLTAVVTEDGHIQLSWTAPDDDSVTGYQVLRRRPKKNEDTLESYVDDTSTTETTWTDTKAPAGTLYVYRVKAINAAGVGPRSNYVNVDRGS